MNSISFHALKHLHYVHLPMLTAHEDRKSHLYMVILDWPISEIYGLLNSDSNDILCQYLHYEYTRSILSSNEAHWWKTTSIYSNIRTHVFLIPFFINLSTPQPYSCFNPFSPITHMCATLVSGNSTITYILMAHNCTCMALVSGNSTIIHIFWWHIIVHVWHWSMETTIINILWWHIIVHVWHWSMETWLQYIYSDGT